MRRLPRLHRRTSDRAASPGSTSPRPACRGPRSSTAPEPSPWSSIQPATRSPSEEAFHKDALALFDKVHAEHPNVVVVGRSLGSGVAIRLASQRPASRLVLVTPYDSIGELAALQFPYFPVRWLLIDKYESGRYAPRITVPTLIVTAEHDEVIPRASTETLYRRFARGVTVLKVIPGAGHNTISENPAYIAALTGAP